MRKLNLGCGRKYLEGYINIDICEKVKADLYFNLNKTPYPFEDNSIDEVLMMHSLEHLDNNKVLKELYRIGKPNAIIKIEVPFSTNGFNHIQHTRCYDWNTFTNLGTIEGSDYMSFKFNLIVQKAISNGMRRYLPFKRFLSYFFPILIANLYVELKVMK